MFIAGGSLGSMLLVRCTNPGAEPPDLSEFRPVECPRVPIGVLGDLAEGVPFDFEYPEAGVECFAVKLGRGAQDGIGPEEDVVAYSYLCTHMGCSLRETYNHEHAVLGPCACHFSTFSLAHRGMVVLGQATQNLVRVQLETEDGMLYATGFEGVLYGELGNRCCDDPGSET